MGPNPCPFRRFNLPGGLDVAEQTFTSLQRAEIPRLPWKGTPETEDVWWLKSDLCVGQATLPLRLGKQHQYFPSPLETLHLHDHVTARAFFQTLSCCCLRDICYHLNPAFSSSVIARRAGDSGNSGPSSDPVLRTPTFHLMPLFQPKCGNFPVHFADFFTLKLSFDVN